MIHNNNTAFSTMKLLFSPSWDAASRASALTGQPVFVYLDENDDMAQKHLYHNAKHDLLDVLRRNFICVKPDQEAAEIEELKDLKSPSFTVIRGSIKDTFVGGDVETFLRKYVPELSPNQPSRKPQRRMSEKEEDLCRIRAQIEADKKERLSQRRYSVESIPKRQKSPVSASQCKLLIRLLDGETVQGTFSSSQTLRDVKRWIESERGLVLSPERDDALPSFAHTSAFALNHYAFCYVGVPRVTFTAGQELTKLSDLGLSPRLALILKPVQNEKAKHLPGLWSSLCGKVKFVTGALYTFFDYGLEDAERDFSDAVDDAQPAFVVPEQPESEEDTKKESVSAGASRMAPVSGRGNQLHVLHDREAEQRQ